MRVVLRRGVGGGCAAALCLLAALARAADWPAFQYDPQHTAFNENARLRLPLANAWTAALGGEGWGTSSAVLVEDSVYAATVHGEVIAFDRRSGAERWRHAAGGSVYLVPAVSDGRLYFGSAAGALVALEAATGAVLWEYETGSNINASPNVAGGVVYFASNDGYAYALEADTGRLKWRRELTGYLLSSPALDADRVYLGTLSGRLVALNRADGSPAWEAAVGSPLRGAPSVSAGLVFIGAADGVLRAFHAGTGVAAWSRAAGAAIFDGLAVSSTAVFFASVNGTLQALAKADGAPLWSFAAGAGVHAAPSLAGDAVVLGSDDGTLYVLGTTTGGVRQSLALTGRIAAPAALGNGQAYVLSDAGSLYALQSPNVAPLAAADLRVNGGTTPVNSQTLAFSWTFRDPDAEDAPSAFQVQVTSTSFEASVIDSGLVFGSQTSYTAPLPVGTYRWRVQTYDALGTPGPFTAGTDSFLIDRTRPAIALAAPSGGEVFIGARGEIAVSFAVTDDNDPAPRSEAWLVQAEDRGSPRGTRPERIAATSGQRLAPLDLDDGLWALQVSATDFASNASTAASGAFEVVHDTLPPRSALAFGEPNFADSARGLVYVASRTVLTLTSSDDMAQTGDGAGLGVAEQTVLLDRTSYFAFVRPAGSTQTILASTFAVLGEDGVKDLRYGAKDVLGHAETLRVSRVGLDGAAPVLTYAFSREPVVRSSASGAWFPEDFAVVWTATDTGSGLAVVSPAGSVTVEGRDIAVSGAAVDRLGHETRASVSVKLDKTAPRVSAGSDVAITEGSSATFAGTVSDNLDPAPAFAWLFRDGRVAAGEAAPTAFYPDEGEFTAVLVSTDHAGHVASSSVTVRVANAAPRLEAGGDRLVKEGQRLILTVGFMDPGLLDAHAASVDWGDGQSSTMTVTEAGGSGSAGAEHAYGDDGLYLAKVTVRDEDGGVSTAAVRVIVGNEAPVLASLADQSAGEGARVSLLGATFTDSGFLDTHTAVVDWGDGTSEPAPVSSKTVQAQHAYGDNGTFAVTVTVSDDDGGTSSRTFTATIANVAPSLAALADQNAAEGSAVSLQGATFTDPGFLDTHSATVDWGDGTSEAAVVSSRVVNASHSYGDNGSYAVTVTVKDDEGGTSARGFTATVSNVAPALAALTAQSAAEGSLVSLQGATFTDPGFLDTHTATVNWGDGTTQAAVISSKTVQAQHAYGDNGAYTVTVTVADDDGGTSTRAFTATVANVPPSLAALADQNADEGSPISLQGASFMDPGFLDSHTAAVDWGDGTTTPATISSQAVQARHAYGDNGTYAVTVTVADDDGGTSARSFTAAISNAAPSLASLADQVAVEGSLVGLPGAAFTDPGFLDAHLATVDWGDGTAEAAAVSSMTVLAQHVYGDNGTYSVKVTVADDDGGTSTRGFAARVSNVAPSLGALANQSGVEGSLVSLQGAAFTDPGFLDTHSATVDWGDGTIAPAAVSSKAVSARHAYGDNGVYAVTVTVSDDDGGTAARTFTAAIANAAPALAVLANQSAAEGSLVSLQGAAFTDAGLLDTHAASVDWGDGTTEAAVVSSKTVQAQHAYGDNGAYAVRVTVKDDDGGTSQRTFTATVSNVAPTLAALADQTAAEGAFVSLPGAAFTDPGFLDTHSATVDWGDGTTQAAAVSSQTVLAQHAYGDNGAYAVTVTVADDDGGTSARSFTASISNAAPSLAPLADQAAVEGSSVGLQGAVFMDPGFLDTHSATVDWGDGTAGAAAVSSMTVLAQHVYGDNGTYSVKVTVADDDGEISTRSFTARVSNAAPSLAALSDQSTLEGSLVSLQGAVFTDPGMLDTHTATVNWGDGMTEAASVSSKTVLARHVYGDNGAFTVTVTVADDDGATSAKTFTATVGNVAPSLAALAGQSAAEGSLVSLQGASFTDPGFLDTHAAVIDWGDGTTGPGTVASQTVSGRHAYGDNGAYAVTVTVTDDDGGTVSRHFTATISNVAPSLAALDDRSAEEGALLALRGAVFTDPGFGDSHAATVAWGDGTTETAAISSQMVSAQHAYGDNGAYTVTVTVADDDGGRSARSFTATVANVAPSLAALADQSAAEGSLVGLQGAVFTDPGSLDSHTGSVAWGDGTTTPAVISSQTLRANHAYGDNGAYRVTVTVSDDDGGTSVKTFTATVSNAAPVLAALADQSAVEGTFIALQGATFTDSGFLDSHSAAVNWGDGTSEAAGVSSQTISARHAYGDNGSYAVTVTVTDDDGGNAARTFTATIANAAPALAAIPDQAAQEGAFMQLPPAAFADVGYLDSHRATVDWGDGTAEPAADIALASTSGRQGTATAGTIQARHAYGDNGTYSAVVSVRDDDGAVSSSTFRVTVTNAAPALAALPDATAVEGAFIQFPPAAFSDPGYKDTHSATVDWGDGTTEPAADIVLTRSAGQEGAATAGNVLARHAYGDNGTYTALVTVRDDDGGAAVAAMRVTVTNAAPAVAALPDSISGAGGVVYVGGQIPVRIFPAYAYRGAGTLTSYPMGPDVVQTFAPAVYSDPGFDNPPGGTREDFTAAVAWGDEQTTSGVAVDETPGAEGLSTVGRAHGAVHHYAANGVYSVTVSVADDDGAAGSRTFSVTVDREPPVTRVGYVGAYLLASAAPAAVPSGLDVFLRSNSDIVLSAEDPRVNDVASGVQRTFWREGQFAPFVLYTGPFRTPGAGSHIVEFFSVDERGNEEPHKLLRIGVDDAAPTSAVSYGTAAVQVFGLPLLTPNTPVTLSAADLEAAGVAVGVARLAYRLDGGPETAYETPFPVPAQGTHALDVLAYDRLGNVSPKKVRFAVSAIHGTALSGVERVDGSGTADVAGPVLSNGPADFSGDIVVNGDVSAATVTIRGQARVSGAVRQGVSPLHPEPIDLALIGELAAAASANALIPADLLVDGALVLGSGRAHALTTGTYVLKGLKLDGGASLAIHGRVDILIDGALEVSGGAALNAAGRADDVNLFVAAAATVSLAGGARVAATVYAPRAAVRVAGNARAAGSLLGRSATVSGIGNVVTNGRTLPPEPASAGGGDKAGKGAKTASVAAAPVAPASGADPAFALRDLYVFPNPAVGGARPTIHVAVGLADKVTIRIYDVSGQDVHQATLDTAPSIIDDGSGPKYAYEYPWNGHIPSGVYLYTIVAERSGQPAVRKAGKFSVVR